MACSTKYCWREHAALLHDGRMVRNQFLSTDDTDEIRAWRERFTNTDVFSSICLYAEADANSPFITPVFFDLDAVGNVERARADALGLCQLLEEWLTVPQDAISVYFSGCKGFHVEVSVDVFEPEASPMGLLFCKELATKAVKAGIKSVDIAVYDSRRIWRLPNSINSKSGLYKIPLTCQELRDIDVPGMMEMAKTPRGEDTYTIVRFCPTAATIHRRALAICKKRPPHTEPAKINVNFARGWRVPPCIKAIEDSTLSDGTRHQAYLCLGRYYAYLNMHPAEILERLVKLDARNPIGDTDSIERLVAWSYVHPGFSGCNNATLTEHCRKETCFYATLTNSNKAERW